MFETEMTLAFGSYWTWDILWGGDVHLHEAVPFGWGQFLGKDIVWFHQAALLASGKINASILQGGYGQNNTVSIIMFHYPQVNEKVHFKVSFSQKKHTLYNLKKFKLKKIIESCFKS